VIKVKAIGKKPKLIYFAAHIHYPDNIWARLPQ